MLMRQDEWPHLIRGEMEWWWKLFLTSCNHLEKGVLFIGPMYHTVYCLSLLLLKNIEQVKHPPQ